MIVVLAWLMLAAVHVTPAIAAFSPRLRSRMYGVQEDATLAIILAHRGALFLAVACACIYAAFDANARPLAVVVVGVSVLSFLAIYLRAGAPEGSLRTIAAIDLVAIAPLAVAANDVWTLV